MSIEQFVQPRGAKPTIGTMIQQLRPEIQRALPAHLNGDRIARLALTCVRKEPKLAECTPESFAGALLTAAALGLEPGVNGEAYLVPYKDKKTQISECTLIVGYQGFAKLFWQHPAAKHLDAQAVYEKDEFDYALGTDPFLRHRPAKGVRGKIVAYYAVAGLKNGATPFVVLSPEDVKQLRGGKTGSSGNIPDPQHWMERKTVLRQLFKLTPKSTQLATAIEADERSGTELHAEQVAAKQDAPAALPAAPSNVDTTTGEVLPDPFDGNDPWANEKADGS